MDICVLGSGSAGNSTALRAGGRAILIDAGFGPRSTAKRLDGTGVGLPDLQHVLLTHLDHDHFNPNWFATLKRFSINLHCHRRHLAELYAHLPSGPDNLDARQLHRLGLLHPFDDQPFQLPVGQRTLLVRPVNFAHDSQGTVGFRIESPDCRIGYATDLGRVTDDLLHAFTDLDLLALESNYDRQMQLASDRPWFLKNRIMSGAGHLSNDEAFAAIRELINRSTRRPRYVVLLHLSRQCNEPARVRQLYANHPDLHPRIHITCQHTPSPWLSASPAGHQHLPGEQLTMFS